MAKRYIFGIWHGGNGYSSVDTLTDIERFTTVTEAEFALQSRAESGRGIPQPFDYVHQPFTSVCTPNADDHASMDIYVITARDESEAMREFMRGNIYPRRIEYADGKLLASA